MRGWDREAAERWLAKILRADTEVAQPYEIYLWLLELGDGLDNEPGEAFAESAEERWDALAEQAPAEDSPAAEEQQEKARIELVHALMRELAGLLGTV